MGRGVVALVLVSVACGRPAIAAPSWTIMGWNNLGMHCMDADYSVFSLLPPYNTIQAQVIDPQGVLVTNPHGITVTYEAMADPDGSINTTSLGKTSFWQYVQLLFGLSLPTDVGLKGAAMPGAGNTPQPMSYDAAAQWFIAEGIPITPYDDAHVHRTYPLMPIRTPPLQGSRCIGSRRDMAVSRAKLVTARPTRSFPALNATTTFRAARCRDTSACSWNAPPVMAAHRARSAAARTGCIPSDRRGWIDMETRSRGRALPNVRHATAPTIAAPSCRVRMPTAC